MVVVLAVEGRPTVLIVSFLSGIWFFAIGFEPESVCNASEDQYPATEEQGKHNLISAHIRISKVFDSCVIHTVQRCFGRGIECHLRCIAA